MDGIGGPGDEVLILGPCALRCVSAEGSEQIVELSTLQARLVARLAIAHPGGASSDELADAVWFGAPPKTAKASLHNQVSRLRKLGGHDVVATTQAGYSLQWPTDLDTASDVLAAAEQLALDGDDAGSAKACEHVLARFRGPAMVGLNDLPGVDAIRRRADAIAHAAFVVRLGSAIRLGRHGWAVAEGERLVGISPFDEQCWVLLAEAYDSAGRRGEALAVVERARRSLRDGMGIEIGARLVAVEAAVLRQRDPASPTAAPALIGREDVVDEVHDALRSDRFAVVRGDAGSGKSAVLAEVAKQSRRNATRVLQVTCVRNPSTPVAVLADLLDELGEQPEPAVGIVSGFVTAIARGSTGPVLLVVDDLHHAGPSTLRALRAASQLPDVAVLGAIDVLATWATSDGRVIDLPPLDAAAIGRIAVASGHQLAEGTGDDMFARLSGGNPLLLEYLLDDPNWTSAAPADAWPLEHVPHSRDLADFVRWRIERLNPLIKIALEIAAVCGPTVDCDLLLSLVPDPVGVEGACRAGLLSADDGVAAFRHGAVQRVIYDDLPPGRRAEIHHLVGVELASSGQAPSSVAHHLVAGAAVDPMGATNAARDAAADATRHGAHREAAAWLEQAERCAGHTADAEHVQIELQIARGDALRLAGEPEHEALLFDAADRADRLGDPRLLAEAAFAVLQLGATTATGSVHAEASALADRAIAAAADHPERRALVAAAASLTHSMSGHPERCRELFVTAEGDAHSAEARCKVLPFAYLALGHPSDAAERRRFADELTVLGAERDDPVVLFEGLQLQFSVALQHADGSAARAAAIGMEALIDRVGDVGRRWSLLYVQAALAHIDGRLDDCERLAEAGLTMFAAVSPSRAMAVYGAQLLPVRWAQGRLEELTDLLAQMVVDQPAVPAWHAALALSVASTDQERADHHALRALADVPSDFTWLASHVIGGRVAAIAGAADTVRQYRRLLEPWSGFVCWQGTCAYGPVDTVLAMLARATGEAAASDRFRAIAVDLSRRLRAPVFEHELARDVPRE